MRRKGKHVFEVVLVSAMASWSLGNLSFPTHISLKTQFVFGSKPQFVSFSRALRKPVRHKFSTRVMGSSAFSSQKPNNIQGLLSLNFLLFFMNRIVNFILYDSYTLIDDPLFDFYVSCCCGFVSLPCFLLWES